MFVMALRTPRHSAASVICCCVHPTYLCVTCVGNHQTPTMDTTVLTVCTENQSIECVLLVRATEPFIVIWFADICHSADH